MATTIRVHRTRTEVSQRSPAAFRVAWAAAVRRIAREDRPILRALAEFDRTGRIPPERGRAR